MSQDYAIRGTMKWLMAHEYKGKLAYAQILTQIALLLHKEDRDTKTVQTELNLFKFNPLTMVDELMQQGEFNIEFYASLKGDLSTYCSERFIDEFQDVVSNNIDEVIHESLPTIAQCIQRLSSDDELQWFEDNGNVLFQLLATSYAPAYNEVISETIDIYFTECSISDQEMLSNEFSVMHVFSDVIDEESYQRYNRTMSSNIDEDTYRKYYVKYVEENDISNDYIFAGDLSEYILEHID